MLSQFPFPMIPLGRINKLLFSGRALAIFANQKQRKEAAREREKEMHRWQLFLCGLAINKKNQFQPIYSQGNASIRGFWFLIRVPPEKKRLSVFWRGCRKPHAQWQAIVSRRCGAVKNCVS
jgi:hypothetical protein